MTKKRKRPVEDAAEKPNAKPTSKPASEPSSSKKRITASKCDQTTNQEDLTQYQDDVSGMDVPAPLLPILKTPRPPICFLDLLPEIRNQIYIIALTRSLRLSIDKMKIPALAQAHGQIRHEAMSIFLGINTFKLEFIISQRRDKFQLKYCCSDSKLRGLDLNLGYITNLQISLKLFEYSTMSPSKDPYATWKLVVPGSDRSKISCTGKYAHPHNVVDDAAIIAQKVKKSVVSWLKKYQPGLGLAEIWSILCFFKMEYIDLLK